MSGLSELFKTYGITGNAAVDTIILAHIIPFVMTYVTVVFGAIKNFLATFMMNRMENVYDGVKKKMFGEIDMRLCVSQDKSIYPLIKNIIFSPLSTSDPLDQKTISMLSIITESKVTSASSYSSNYANTYELFLDSQNNITVEKNIDYGSAISKKYFKYQNYYIVVSENKKTDFSHYSSKFWDYHTDKVDNKTDNKVDDKEYFILFEAIRSSSRVAKDENILTNFLDQRFKLKLRLPYKYIVKLENGPMYDYLSNLNIRYKNNDSCNAELLNSDGIETFLSNTKVKDFYSFINSTTDKKKSSSKKGISSSVHMMHRGNAVNVDTLMSDLTFTDTTNISNVCRMFEPSFKSILQYFFGGKFDTDWVKGGRFYFKNNKIILIFRVDDKTGLFSHRYVCVVSFQEIIDQKEMINLFSELINFKRCPVDDDSEEEELIKKIMICTYKNSTWRSTECDSRSYDTIYLPSKTKQLIISEMDKFVCYEKIYKEIGVPYKKGFLLYGPPGTGKTSLVRALAHKYRLPIYIIDVNNEQINDETIAIILNSISGNGNRIVLFEDIDSAFAGREELKTNLRETSLDTKKSKDTSKEKTSNIEPVVQLVDQRKFLTYSGLLNALDGVLTSQHGTIVIMTTNYKEKLGDALIRPGRIDFHIELTYCDREQIIEMTKNIIIKSYKTIESILSEKKVDQRMKKMIFCNPFDLSELDKRIDEFANNLMKRTQVDSHNIVVSTVKPCELQIYILKYLSRVEDIFNCYQELLDKDFTA